MYGPGLVFSMHSQNLSNSFVVTEYAGGGDLFSHLQENNVQELSALTTYFRQIMSAVAHCHSLNVTFHGLQPDSLLLDEAKEMIKLISFDTATWVTHSF
jgi:serine/threonine protein kinase